LVGNPLAVVKPRKTKKDYAFTGLKIKNSLFLEILFGLFFRFDNRKRIANRKKMFVFTSFSLFLAKYPKAENLWVISRVSNPILRSIY
jgi:hypothetical protein